MSRWEPNAGERLVQAAMDLYLERGYEQATVAEIAERAGLTERTFFRHFADKREVLFSGSEALQDLMVGAVADAPDGTAPIDAVGAALVAAAELLQERRAHSERRQAIINANTALQERELIKLATLATALAAALRRRGVAAATAGLTAETGIAVFKVSYERWITSSGRRRFTTLIHESLAELKVVTAGG